MFSVLGFFYPRLVEFDMGFYQGFLICILPI